MWAHRVKEAEPERMLTFTRIGEDRDSIRLGLQQVVRHIRVSGYEIQYWGVIELHESGKPHIHVLQKGSYIPKKVVVEACSKANWGFNDIRKIDNSWSATHYCAKHLCHSHGRRWAGRLIRYSKKFFCRPEAFSDDKEAAKEMAFSVVFGRADAIADKYRRSGCVVEQGDLGVDWIMGEEVVGGQVAQRYARDVKKGYNLDSLNYDNRNHVDLEIYKFLKQPLTRRVLEPVGEAEVEIIE
jgi:hypothetical protein